MQRAWTVAALLSLLTSAAHAQDEPQRRREPKQQLGVLVWGSSYFQVVWRAPITERLRFELGGLGGGVHHSAGVNASMGLSCDFIAGSWWSPYLAGGVGAAGAALFGAGDFETEEEMMDDKAPPSTYSGVLYMHTRAGVALSIADDRSVYLTFEGGVWLGALDSDNLHSARSILWPVGGFGFYVEY